MAISKEHKKDVVARYVEWLQRSSALIVTEYAGMNMASMDSLRARVREAGGEFHVAKNTLMKIAAEQAGIKFDENLFSGSSAIAFAFQDAPAIAKVMTDFTKESTFVKVKGGYLDRQVISADGVKALADLPPLPVMRATLLGTILAPASQLVRTLAEPGRQIAAVVKAYADRDAAPEAA